MAIKLMSESERLAAVRRFDRFRFDMNKNLQNILQLAAYLYSTPVAFLTLIDEHTQHFKVNLGFEVSVMPRETSFCTRVVADNAVMVVPDARQDERFADNPLVICPPNIAFYAGAPLSTHDHFGIGTLCVMDVIPKQVDDKKKQMLEILAHQAINIMELETTYKLLNEKMNEIEMRNSVLRDIAHIQSHEFRGPLSTIMGVMNAIREEDYDSPREYLQMLDDAVKRLDEKIHVIVQSTQLARSSYTT